jgi:hypothetical protein
MNRASRHLEPTLSKLKQALAEAEDVSSRLAMILASRGTSAEVSADARTGLMELSILICRLTPAIRNAEEELAISRMNPQEKTEYHLDRSIKETQRQMCSLKHELEHLKALRPTAAPPEEPTP